MTNKKEISNLLKKGVEKYGLSELAKLLKMDTTFLRAVIEGKRNTMKLDLIRQVVG